EYVQLFYQTALLGRRDLPLAPDPRSGFEMVLLRMLAFKPQGVLEIPANALPVSGAPTKPTAPVSAPASTPAAQVSAPASIPSSAQKIIDVTPAVVATAAPVIVVAEAGPMETAGAVAETTTEKSEQAPPFDG